MTELTDLNDTDALNTAVTGQSTEGNVANMGGMDNLFQATLGMLSRFRNSNIFRLRDNTDKTRLLAFDLSGLTTATTRTQKAPNYNGTISSHAVGAAIASASSIDLGAASGSSVHITGTTTITALGTADAGIEKTAIFDGALILTHNGTSLILPGAANINTAAGDTAVFVSEGSGNWRCISYQRASGGFLSPVQSASTTLTNQTEVSWTGLPATTYKIEILIAGLSTNGTQVPRIYIGDAGGYETTGYLGAVVVTVSGSGTMGTAVGTGVPFGGSWAGTSSLSGKVTLSLINPASNTWVFDGVLNGNNAVYSLTLGAHKSLSAVLDRVQLTMNGTDQFDLGNIKILYYVG